jgi:WD40 repeat protein
MVDIVPIKIIDELINIVSFHTPIIFSPDGKYFAGCLKNFDLCVWETKSKIIIKKFNGHINRISYISFSTSGTKIISCGINNDILIFDWNNEKEAIHKWREANMVISLLFIPNSLNYVMVIQDAFYIINSYSGTIEDIKKIQGEANSISFNSNGSKIVFTYLDDNKIIIYDTVENLVDRFYNLDIKNTIIFAKFSPNDKYIFSISNEGILYIWDIMYRNLISQKKLILSPIDKCNMTFNDDGTKIIIVSILSNYGVYEIDVSRLSDPIIINENRNNYTYKYLTFCPDNYGIIAYNIYSDIVFENIINKTVVLNNVNYIISYNGSVILFFYNNCALKVIDSYTGELIQRIFLPCHVEIFSLSRDGMKFAYYNKKLNNLTIISTINGETIYQHEINYCLKLEFDILGDNIISIGYKNFTGLQIFDLKKINTVVEILLDYNPITTLNCLIYNPVINLLQLYYDGFIYTLKINKSDKNKFKEDEKSSEKGHIGTNHKIMIPVDENCFVNFNSSGEKYCIIKKIIENDIEYSINLYTWDNGFLYEIISYEIRFEEKPLKCYYCFDNICLIIFFENSILFSNIYNKSNIRILGKRSIIRTQNNYVINKDCDIISCDSINIYIQHTRAFLLYRLEYTVLDRTITLNINYILSGSKKIYTNLIKSFKDMDIGLSQPIKIQFTDIETKITDAGQDINGLLKYVFSSILPAQLTGEPFLSKNERGEDIPEFENTKLTEIFFIKNDETDNTYNLNKHNKNYEMYSYIGEIFIYAFKFGLIIDIDLCPFLLYQILHQDFLSLNIFNLMEIANKFEMNTDVFPYYCSNEILFNDKIECRGKKIIDTNNEYDIDLSYSEDIDNPVFVTNEKDKISFGDANFKNIEENIKIMYNYAINKQLCALTSTFKIFNYAINILFNLENDIIKLNILIRGEKIIDFDIFMNYFKYVDMIAGHADFIKLIIRENYDKEENKEKYLKELLRFVTGSTGIPAGGYRNPVLHVGGPPCFKLIDSQDLTIFAHTCFNYVDINRQILVKLIDWWLYGYDCTKNYLYQCFSLEKLIENSSNFSMVGGSKAYELSLKMMSKNNMTKLFVSTKKYKIVKINKN